MYCNQLTMQMQAEAKDIFSLLFDIEKWGDLLPHCVAAQLIEQDENHQVAVIKIQSGKKIDTIKTVRRFEQNKWISFEQTPPPAPLQIHRGKWILTDKDGGTEVVVIHELKTKFGRLLESFIWHFFVKKHSLATLNKVKKEVEK